MSPLPRRIRLLGSNSRFVSLAIVVAALAMLVPPGAAAASPGPAACAEYSVCGGPTGAAGGSGAGRTAGSGSGQHAHATVSGWIRLPLVDYPLTPAVAALAAAVVGCGVALWLVIRLRARPRRTAD